MIIVIYKQILVFRIDIVLIKRYNNQCGMSITKWCHRNTQVCKTFIPRFESGWHLQKGRFVAMKRPFL